eukprot:evm.model.scf_1553.2 EVM.evm.TU.scf_1553.2   scf_1553:37463-38008(-)
MLLRIRLTAFLAGFGVAAGFALFQLQSDVKKSHNILAAEVRTAIYGIADRAKARSTQGVGRSDCKAFLWSLWFVVGKERGDGARWALLCRAGTLWAASVALRCRCYLTGQSSPAFPSTLFYPLLMCFLSCVVDGWGTSRVGPSTSVQGCLARLRPKFVHLTGVERCHPFCIPSWAKEGAIG